MRISVAGSQESDILAKRMHALMIQRDRSRATRRATCDLADSGSYICGSKNPIGLELALKAGKCARLICSSFPKKIHRLLARLEHPRRRSMLLHSFAEEQRLALERWMVHHYGPQAVINRSRSDRRPQIVINRSRTDRRPKAPRAVRDSSAQGHHVIRKRPAAVVASVKCLDGNAQGHVRQAPSRRRLVNSKQSSDGTSNSQHLQAGSCHFTGSYATRRTGSPYDQRVSEFGRGVVTHHRHHCERFSALVHIERLELRTRQVSERSLAFTFREALLAIKQRIVSELSSNNLCAEAADEVIPRMLQEMITDTLSLRGLDPESDLGLYFRVSTPARRWIGSPLCGPVFRFRNLSEGLHGWRVMRMACRESSISDAEISEKHQELWLRVRHAHLELWASVGRNREQLSKRLDALHERTGIVAAQRTSGTAITNGCKRRGVSRGALKSSLPACRTRACSDDVTKVSNIIADKAIGLPMPACLRTQRARLEQERLEARIRVLLGCWAHHAARSNQRAAVLEQRLALHVRRAAAGKFKRNKVTLNG